MQTVYLQDSACGFSLHARRILQQRYGMPLQRWVFSQNELERTVKGSQNIYIVISKSHGADQIQKRPTKGTAQPDHLCTALAISAQMLQVTQHLLVLLEGAVC